MQSSIIVSVRLSGRNTHSHIIRELTILEIYLFNQISIFRRKQSKFTLHSPIIISVCYTLACFYFFYIFLWSFTQSFAPLNENRSCLFKNISPLKQNLFFYFLFYFRLLFSTFWFTFVYYFLLFLFIFSKLFFTFWFTFFYFFPWPSSRFFPTLGRLRSPRGKSKRKSKKL